MRFDRFRAIVGSMFTPDDAGGIAERYAGVDVRLASPLVLAYIGDAYFHLFVRTRLLSFEQSQVHVLSDFAAQTRHLPARQEREESCAAPRERRRVPCEHGFRSALGHAVSGGGAGAPRRDR